jgi:hypothetical protein
MLKLSLRLLLAPLLTIAVQLHAAETTEKGTRNDEPWNPADTSKLEMIVCLDKEGIHNDIILTLCRYFTPLDNKTYDDALEKFKKREKSELRVNKLKHKPISVYCFFYEPYADTSNRSQNRTLLKLVAMNGKYPEEYLKNLEALSDEDAHDNLFNKPLTLTWEPCDPDHKTQAKYVVLRGRKFKN